MSVRAVSPNIPTEAATAENVAADEALLIQLATAITDIKAFESQIWKLWREEVHLLLPEAENLDGESDGPPSFEG